MVVRLLHSIRYVPRGGMPEGETRNCYVRGDTFELPDDDAIAEADAGRVELLEGVDDGSSEE